ncbi:MAG: TetR/AcrR family transcriptional regulator [Pseudomonadota bacterium]
MLTGFMMRRPDVKIDPELEAIDQTTSIPCDLTLNTQTAFGTKTKGRILLASLNLFNRFGFERTTTAQLAEGSDVLEGTLWYHFKTKNALVLAHLDVLETRLEEHLNAPLSESLTKIIEHILGVFDLLWDFRYLLRDPIAAIQDDDARRSRLQQIYERVEKRIEARLYQAEEMGLIDLSETDANALAVSCFLTGRYGLDYARIRLGDDLDVAAFRQIGIPQILSLLKPHLTEKGKARIENTPELASVLLPKTG